MDISSYNIEIESLMNKIKRENVILNSSFQRGEVWENKRKRKFVDTILRGWPIPPIILMKNIDNSLEIVDGLQRVTTIFQFVVESKIKVDGTLTPSDDKLLDIDNLTMQTIYDEVLKNKILSTPLTVYEISNATSEEISEIFNRFNSPLSLNTVEKRNAYFGNIKNQIQSLTRFFEDIGANINSIGFSNRRGIYDDTILKVCYSMENEEVINKKITSEMLLSLYKEDRYFSEKTIRNMQNTMEKLMNAILNNQLNEVLRFSRTAIFSFLLFICGNNVSEKRVKEILMFLGQPKKNYNQKLYSSKGKIIKKIFDEYSMYASTDVKSICIRQYILYLLLSDFDSFSEVIESISTEELIKNGERFNYLKNEFKR